MSGLNLFPGLSTITNTVSATGIFPTSVFNQKPAEGSQPSGLLSQATGLLSHTPDLLSGGALDWATPKPPIVWDASFKQLNFAILLRLLSFVRGFIPPIIWGFVLLGIPPIVSFYELTLRRFLPQLPSVITIAFKLYKNGLLTMGTITWLLPQSMIGGLGALGGVAMGGTAVLASGATAVVGGVMGGVTGLAGGATNAVTQGINGLGGATNLVGDATKGIAEGISLIQSGEKEVAENIAHLLSGEQGAAGGVLVPTIAKDVIQATVGNTNAIAGAAMQSITNPVAAIGATQVAVADGATKLTHALGSVNPLPNLLPTQDLGSMLRPKIPGFA